MNYKVIGTKAARTEWFSTLSKWSLEEEGGGIDSWDTIIYNFLSMIVQILKHVRLNTQIILVQVECYKLGL